MNDSMGHQNANSKAAKANKGRRMPVGLHRRNLSTTIHMFGLNAMPSTQKSSVD